MARNFDTPFIKGVEAELSAEPRAMTPIERASRALASSHYAARFGKPSDDPHVVMNVDARWPDFEVTVRAVLQAIREPSEAMKTGAEFSELTMSYGGENSFEYLSEENAADVWRGMVDAALAE